MIAYLYVGPGSSMDDNSVERSTLKMATRNVSGANVLGHTTDFTLHLSQRTNERGNLIDYTEFRLKRYILEVQDLQQLMALNDLLKQYLKGLVAIAWRSGKPCYINVTKENERKK